MTLTFYYSEFSTAAITKAVLDALKLPDVEVKTVDLRGGACKRPEFLKINPNGKIPVIIHDGEVIWESAAITIYLGETFGVSAGLWPEPGKQRGQALKWVVWGNVTLADATSKFMMAGDNSDAAAKAKEELFARLAVLDGALQGRHFMLGDKYSLVDAHLNSILAWITMMHVTLETVPNIAAWVERCKAYEAK